MASNCEDILNLQSLSFEASSCNQFFKPLDDVLRCRICFEYFNTCMITKCSHNYCSFCIRRYMSHKTQCPTCFQEAFESDLRNNRLVDEVLRIYLTMKDNFQEEPKSEIQMEEYSQPILELSQSTSCSSAEIKNKKEESDTKAGEVSCPVCYTPVVASRINIHLDTCLKMKERTAEKKTLSKVVYHLMSDKDIKKKLKEYGLNPCGDRKTLIKRHKHFITLYNANADSLKPKSLDEILVDLEAQELEERLNAADKVPSQSKKLDQVVVEKDNETYIKENQSQFSALIQDVQRRELGRIVKIKKEPPETSEVCTVPRSDDIVPEKSTTRSEELLNVKQEPLTPPPSKDCHTIEREDSITSSPKELPLDAEKGKLQLSLMKKRKKGRIGADLGSPQKK